MRGGQGLRVRLLDFQSRGTDLGRSEVATEVATVVAFWSRTGLDEGSKNAVNAIGELAGTAMCDVAWSSGRRGTRLRWTAG